MIPSATPAPEVVEVTRLDHLPLVGAMLRELAVKDTLEARMPPPARHAVTTGEGVEVLVRTSLPGEQALSRGADTVAGDDLEGMFQRPLEAAHCHDNRLGRALDALWTTGLDRMDGAVISQASGPYALEVARRPTETTSLKVSGAYARDEEESGPLGPLGSSREHRPDRKPRLVGLTVTAEGVPGWGPVTDGHGRDRTEPRVHLTPRRQPLPDLGEPLVVADSQFCAGETMALAAAPRRRFVPLVPQTVGWRQEVVDSPALSALPLRGEQPGRRHGELARYAGASVVCPSRWKTAAGEVREWPWRVVVVESTPVAKATAPHIAAAQPTERVALATLQPPWQRRTVACEADAHQAATRGRRELALNSHRLTSTVNAAWVPKTRATRGRPPKQAPRPQPQVWRVSWQVHEATEAITARAQPARRLVLATHGLDAQALTDADRRQADQGQPSVELSLKWAKTPAALAPIFLETPTRMAALGGVYWRALLVYTRGERQVRKRLVEGGDTLPDRPAPRQHPTARTVFQLRRTIAVVSLRWAGQCHRQVPPLSPHQLHVVRLRGYDRSISTLPHQNSG